MYTLFRYSLKFKYLSFFSHSLISYTAKSIGCYRDTARRAVTTLERRSRLLRGSYRRRRFARRKCALAAQKRGYRVFAVQHGGWCAASKTGHLTYRRYGKSNRCRNGKGGPWANDVYVLKGKELEIFPSLTFDVVLIFHAKETRKIYYNIARALVLPNSH